MYKIKRSGTRKKKSEICNRHENDISSECFIKSFMTCCRFRIWHGEHILWDCLAMLGKMLIPLPIREITANLHHSFMFRSSRSTAQANHSGNARFCLDKSNCHMWITFIPNKSKDEKKRGERRKNNWQIGMKCFGFQVPVIHFILVESIFGLELVGEELGSAEKWRIVGWEMNWKMRPADFQCVCQMRITIVSVSMETVSRNSYTGTCITMCSDITW